MSSKNYLSVGTVFLILAFLMMNCEKEVVQVPTDELYNPNANYEPFDADSIFQIDSIKIIECPGPAGWGEYPDVVFSYIQDFGGIEDTSDQVFYNVQQSNLPIVYAPVNQIFFAGEFGTFPYLEIGVHEVNVLGDPWFDMAIFNLDINTLSSINHSAEITRITLKDFHIVMHLYFHFE